MAGYFYKYKLKVENAFLEFLKEFNDFLISNISLFKNNVTSIIDNFIIMQKNKNAKFCEIFEKNNNIYTFNEKIVSKYVKNAADMEFIKVFLNKLGSNDYEFEKQKIEKFGLFLEGKIKAKKEEIKVKADLNFKLLLAIGAVICIIIWWVYGCFNTF